MDIDDPIQQLLKNTGWTCDDLLEKLQKYKFQKEKKDEVEFSAETENNKSESKISVADTSKDEKTNSVENTKKIEKQNNSITVIEEFSDTDEEEVEVNITHSNIIDEIIDDITSAENGEALDHTIENATKTSQGNDKEEQEEITEVRVIEINEDDEDYFDGSSCSAAKQNSLISDSKNVEYLETFPRKNPVNLKSIDLTDESNFTNEEYVNEKPYNKDENGGNEKGHISEKISEMVNSENIHTSTTGPRSIFESVEDISKIKEYRPLNEKYTKIADFKFGQIVEKSDCQTIDCTDTTTLYKRNCEKVLNSSIITLNDCDNMYKPLENNTISEGSGNQEDENYSDKESTTSKLEDIRNNLKLQLNCLRTRKKGHFLQQLRSKVMASPECSKKQKMNTISKNKDTIPQTATTEEFSKIKNDLKRPSSTHKGNDQVQDLYTQTNEFGLVILSVEGGINLEEQVSEKHIESRNIGNEESSNTISSLVDNSVDSNSSVLQNNTQKCEDSNEPNGVLDEIRKIIRKQKQINLISNKKPEIETVCNFKKAGSRLNFFSESINVPFSKPVEEFDEKTNRTSISADNSESSLTNDDTNQNINKNSPFVSNTLDEFLTGNSKLNISYNIPKCCAEEGLTDSYQEESPLVLKKIVKTDTEKKRVLKKTETIKAKTVAQKRKLLEKQRLKELRKQTKMVKQQFETKSEVNSVNTYKQYKRSYIEINNKKIWVRGTKPNICLAKINSLTKVSPPIKQCHQRRKLSLLTGLTKKCNEEIKYLPGPLCKKSLLQISGRDSWKTETKLLPKISLEVTPKIGQCLPPNIISRLPGCDGVVTADLAEFALCVLKTKIDTIPKEITFKFPMKYMNNQEKIIVKKQKVIPSKYNVQKQSNKETCVDSVVKNVIDDLIRYVEIKEIAPTLIKEEEVEYRSNDSTIEKMPVIAENVSTIFKKPYKKKSKVELELSRLSCKVVNVEVEENSTEELCGKAYCQLGCVCKSLKCDGMITYHCQNVDCMLECKCPREKSIEYDKLMLPAGTDILSRDTVTRIEDEAKKDLAKVEREFTQMVIHTNDKTIVVGTGGRHKSRRCTKTPLKYSDYIDSNFECIDENVKTKVQKKEHFFKQCFVSLEKLNLQDIEPYCMFHNLYSCYCKGKSLSPVDDTCKKLPKRNSIPIFSANEKTEINSTIEDKYSKNINSTPPKLGIQKESLESLSISVSPKDQNETNVVSTNRRPIRINRKLKEDFAYSSELDFHFTGCARTLGIPNHLKINRKRSVKSLKKLVKGDFCNNITQSEILKANLLQDTSEALEVDILKKHIILESEFHNPSRFSLTQNAVNENRHKRKQVLEIRNDDINSKSLINHDLAIQRRKKHGLVPKKNTVIEPVFEGEIIVDERNMELLQKMGNRTVMEGYARLLPWTALIQSFNKGDIKIWCMVDQPSRLLINKGDKVPPKNYIDIRQTTQSTEVILWILSSKLPRRYHEDHVSFILKQTKDNYEICGLCTKNPNETNDITDIRSEKEIIPKVESDKNGMLFKHKDLNGVHQLMYISKDKFKLQELVEENLAAVGETSIEKNKLYMWAALPEIYQMCKWRMIFLNSDFTFLYFTKVKYSIKYTDLLNAGSKAKEANCTVILRNSLICNPYDHSAFGIYFDAHYQDRLFIGPYFKQHKDNDIETLRYINKSLVCTESFNKMQGKTDYKCGHWLVERPYNRISGKLTIDLTKKTSFKRGLKRKNVVDVPHTVKKPKCAPQESAKVIVTQNNEFIKVLDTKPKTPEEFNRYIITNIPHLGYLGAFQHEDSCEIDVSWPFENKLLRFPNVNSATDFLQCRFSSLLQPVPETFKINVIVLTHIDLEKTKPIDASILSGHYICGEFGCYNIKSITKEFCTDKIGISREDLLNIFARRAQMFVRQKIGELADVVHIPKTDKCRHDIVSILNKARKNVESLKKMETSFILEKNNLLVRKRELASEAYHLISTLPENEKNVETWKFRQILRKQSILLPKTEMETIEIADSDEEEQNIFPKNKSIQNAPNQDGKSIVNNENSRTVSSDINFMDKTSEFSATTSLSIPDPTKVITYPPQRKLKSILKSSSTSTPSTSSARSSSPLIRRPMLAVAQCSQSIDKSPNSSKRQYLTGVKLVKTCEGKLMLVSDDKPENFKSFKTIGGKQVVIKNNQIMSVKPISPQKKDIVTSEKVALKIPDSPPKTIILKKSALLKNSQILSVNDRILLQNKNTENNVLKDTTLTTQDVENVDLTNAAIEKQVNLQSKNKAVIEIHGDKKNNLESTDESVTTATKVSSAVDTYKDTNSDIVRETQSNAYIDKEDDNSMEKKNIDTSRKTLLKDTKIKCESVEILQQDTSNKNLSRVGKKISEDVFRRDKDKETNTIIERVISKETKLINFDDKYQIKPPDIEFNDREDKECKNLSNIENKNDETVPICPIETHSKTATEIFNDFESNATMKGNTITKIDRDTNLQSSANVIENVFTINNDKSSEHSNTSENTVCTSATKLNSIDNADDCTKNNLSCNNEKTFLANAVSETCPSKNNHERSKQINLTNAATLTHMKNAANDVKNTCSSLIHKESERNYFTANSENSDTDFFIQSCKFKKTDPLILVNENSSITPSKNDTFFLNNVSELVLSKINNETIITRVNKANNDEVSKEGKFEVISVVTSDMADEIATKNNCLSINTDSCSEILKDKLLGENEISLGQITKDSSYETYKFNSENDCNGFCTNKKTRSISKSINRKDDVRMTERNNNLIDNEESSKSMVNDSVSYENNDTTSAQVSYDTVNTHSKEILPLVTSKETPEKSFISAFANVVEKTDEICTNSTCEAFITKDEVSITQSDSSSEQEDFTCVKICQQSDQNMSTQTETIDTSKIQISTIVDHEALEKNFNDVIATKSKINEDLVKNFNLSEPVTISAQAGENTLENITSIMEDDHNSTSECNSQNMTYKKPLCENNCRLGKDSPVKNNTGDKNTKKKYTKVCKISKKISSNKITNGCDLSLKNDVVSKNAKFATEVKCKEITSETFDQITKSQNNKGSKKTKMVKQKSKCKIRRNGTSEKVKNSNSKLDSEKTEPNIIETKSIKRISQTAPDKQTKSEKVVSELKEEEDVTKSNITHKIHKTQIPTNSNDDINSYNVLHTCTGTLKTIVSMSQDFGIVSGDKLAINNNFVMSNSEIKSNETDTLFPISNQNEDKQIILHNSDNRLNSVCPSPLNDAAVSKFPLSKRISNVVIHTIQVQNSSNDHDIPAENTDEYKKRHPNNGTALSTEAEISLMKNDILKKNDFPPETDKILDLLSNNIDANITQVSCKNSCDIKDNNSNTSTEANSKASNITSNKKTTFKRPIKYFGAKVDTAFTIDSGSLSRKSKKPLQRPLKIQNERIKLNSDTLNKLLKRLDEKDSFIDRGRKRKEAISTNDLVIASRILGTDAHKNNKEIVEKIYTLAEHAIKDKSCTNVNIIDQKHFLRNAEIAEKVIDIGNLKKKLRANISEDSNSDYKEV